MAIEKWLMFAIELEDKSKDFYDDCLKKTHNKAAKTLFKFLEKEEIGHELLLVNLLQGVAKENKVKSREEAWIKHKMKIPIFTEKDRLEMMDSSLANMLNEAMQLEMDGRDMYLMFAKEEKDLHVKSLLNWLAQEEMKHREVITNAGRALFGRNL